MSSQKEKVALNSVLASAVMSVSKFTVGFMTGSLGLISEGLHSLLDLGATLLTFFAVRISDKPADDKHHYGHGKIESVAALAETALLMLTSVWIMYEAISRLIEGGNHVQVTWWAVAVILASIAIDFHRARALSRVAKETKSQALEADALHFSSDILSSSVVLLGLIFVYLGWPNGDSYASIGVALFVCKAGWDMGRRTIDTLIDAAPEGISSHVSRIVSTVPAVLEIEQIRARPVGNILYIDLSVKINRTLPITQVHKIKEVICDRIIEEIPEAELSITTVPVALDTETTQQKVLLIASNMHLHIHHLFVHKFGGKLSVTMDIEIDGRKTMQEAHDIASEFEQEIIRDLGADIEVDTHIEPLVTEQLEGQDLPDSDYQEMLSRIHEIAKSHGKIKDLHDVRIRQTEHGLIIVYHCLVDGDISVAMAHDYMDAFERVLRVELSNVARVIGHAETVMH